MPALAVGLAGIDARNPFAAADILVMGYGFHVIGINASSVAAEVVEFQTVWDRALQHFVGKSVGHLFLKIVLNLAITIAVAITKPAPAGFLELN